MVEEIGVLSPPKPVVNTIWFRILAVATSSFSRIVAPADSTDMLRLLLIAG